MSVENSNALKQLARTSLGALATVQSREAARAIDESSQWVSDRLVIQCCQDCGRGHYPARPLCPHCLSENLWWKSYANEGRLLSFTNLYITLNSLFREGAPWRIGLVAHESGTNLHVFLDSDNFHIGQKVAVFSLSDTVGEAVFFAADPDACGVQGATSLARKFSMLT